MPQVEPADIDPPEQIEVEHVVSHRLWPEVCCHDVRRHYGWIARAQSAQADFAGVTRYPQSGRLNPGSAGATILPAARIGKTHPHVRAGSAMLSALRYVTTEAQTPGFFSVIWRSPVLTRSGAGGRVGSERERRMDDAIALYLDLMKRCLLDAIYERPEYQPVAPTGVGNGSWSNSAPRGACRSSGSALSIGKRAARDSTGRPPPIR